MSNKMIMRNLLILLLLSGCTSAQKLELFTRTSATTGKTIPVYTKGRFYYNANPNVVVSNYSRQWVDTYDPTTLYFPAYGTKPKYYISNTGATANSGTDSLHPWPLSKVQGGAVLPMGSVILFHRGQTFTGTVNISANTSAAATDSLIYDSYGVGARPILTTMATLPNSDTASKWRQVSGLANVWALKTASQFTYTPRIWLSGTEYPRASDSSKISATKPTSFRNADFQFIYVYSTSNPATNYTSITTASVSNNTLDISGQYLVAVRNLDIRGSQGACLDLSLNNGVLVEKCIIGKDGNRGGMRNNNVTNVVVKNNLFDSGERNKLDFNIATEGGDGCTFGQNGAHSIEVANNYFLDWRHTGYLIEDDGTTATDSVVNVRYHDNYITAPDIDYGRAFGVYYFKGSNVQMDHNVYKSCPTQNQIAADGFISQYNRYDSITNVAYFNRPTGGALSIGHSSFIARNMQFLYDTVTNCSSFGVELTTPAAGTPGYGATNCMFKGMVFQNNGWDLYTPTTDPQSYPFNSDIIVRNRRDTNYLFVHNNSFINNTFNRSTSEPPISYGQDSSTTTRFFLETTGTFNSKNGTAGDVMSNNYTNTSYSYPVVANTTYRAAEFNPELESNTNAAVDTTGAWGLSGGGAAWAAIRNNASVTTPFEYLATYNSVANKDAYVGFDTTWTLTNWFNWQFAVKVDSATGNYYYQNYAVTDTGKMVPAQFGDLYGLRKYSDGTVVAGYYRSGNWNVLKSFTYKLNSTSCYAKASVGSNKTLLNAKTRRDRSNFGTNATYTLGASAYASAGIFKPDGTLIRTLFGGVNQAAGTYTVNWDGKDDGGNYVADGSYNAKVASNNIQTQWAVIGNTSTYPTGSTVHNYSGNIYSMAFNGNYAYYGVGYNEHLPSQYKFLLSAPQQKLYINSEAGASVRFVATDGTKVYYASTMDGAKQGIYAMNLSDDSYYTFSSGVAVQAHWARNYTSVIDTISSTLQENPIEPNGNYLTNYGGLAVQKTGNYLFASYVDTNQIHVLNKTTGALVQNITTFRPPKGLAVDGNDNLWIISGTNTVARYTVNSDGTLSAATLTLSGLVNPLSLSVSPDNTTIAIADGSTKQQIRFFNTTTGVEGTPLGQLGGYVNTPDVANDKFMFKDLKQVYRNEIAFVAYQPDGSFWVGDQGNLRILHFAANNTYIEKIQCLGYLYSVFADRNNTSRVFANYLEFNIDWTKPFNITDGSNGLWTHTKNWGYGISYAYDDQFNRLRAVSTLSNGRTYALLHHYYYNTTKVHRWQVVELTSTGLRFTGVEPSITGQTYDMSYGFNDDGSLLYIDNTNAGTATNWYKKPLTGFDSTGNPLWGAAQQIASVTPRVATDPINQSWTRENLLTSTGKIAMFNPEPSSGYHIGFIKNGGTAWAAQTAASTFTKYSGEFPDDGTFDIGNGTQYYGSIAMAKDSLLVYSYRGEFWKNSQTNKWDMFADNGLFLKQFGITGIEAKLAGEATAGIAGSLYSGTFMKLPSGDYAVVHNDESIGWHGAAHLWKITGTNTVQTQTMPITKSGPPVLAAPGYTDLLADLPVRDTLRNGIGKWTTSYDGSGQYIPTDNLVYKAGERSMLIHSDGQSRWVKGNLGIINSASWKMTCQMSYPEAQEPGDNFFDILDINGKIILRISRPATTYPNIAIKANSTTIATGDQTQIAYKPLPLSISTSGNTISVTFSNYQTVTTSVFDATADITKPKTIMFSSNSTPAAHQITISNLRLYTN